MSAAVERDLGLSVSTLTSPRSGLLESQTSPHRPQRSTTPLTCLAMAVSLLEIMVALSGRAMTMLRVYVVPRGASRHPPGWEARLADLLAVNVNGGEGVKVFRAQLDAPRPDQSIGMLISRWYQAAVRLPTFTSFQAGWT